MLSLSSTAISDASVCLKKYQYHFVDRLTMRHEDVPRPMRIGIWAHRCLQDLHTGHDWQKGLASVMGWAIGPAGLDGEAMQSIYDQVRLLMHGYVKHWEKDNSFKVLAAEEELRAKLGNVELRATNDLRIAGGRGQQGLIEHKTTSDIPPASWRAADPQTALQTVLGQLNGHDIGSVTFNYLNTRTQPDDPKTFLRTNVVRSDAMLGEAMRDIVGIVKQIADAHVSGHFPRSRHILSCRWCPYNEVCVQEYQQGKPNLQLRMTKLRHDDGWREGQA